ncbi:MAG: FeoA domain-containing protein [Candidatus Krumholzibacteriota bacterium]|nr:FeoA domain-containing protein [Candidatus Krumholzibacteriota bacterium]
MIERNRSLHDPVEEALEAVWVLDEEGRAATLETVRMTCIDDRADAGLLARLVEDGLLERTGDVYSMTAKGRELGEAVVRRHRLAERLMVDVLQMPDPDLEDNACRFEHFLSPEVTDHICTLLGHPKVCPHNKQIPPGPCCRGAGRTVETAVGPLRGLRSGERGRIRYIATGRHQRLDRLTALGLFPGRIVRVHQREPLFVVMLDETQIALDKDIVDDIYVVKV